MGTCGGFQHAAIEYARNVWGADAGIVVVDYRDSATGTMIETSDGGGHFTEVVLKPRVCITEDSDAERAKELHHKAHELCFIANSVNFPVRAESQILIEKSAAAVE